MAETGTAPGSSMPWKPTTQRAAMSRVHTGGALWGEVQKKSGQWSVGDVGRSTKAV